MENLLWRNSKWGSKLVAMAIACVALVWVAIPFLWAFNNSIKTEADTFRQGAVIPFLQFTPSLDAWKFVLSDPQALNCLFSSALVGVGTTLFVLILGTPAAYSLARFEFKRMKSRDITLWFLSQRVLPPVVVLTPFYILLAELGLIDTWLGLILLYSTFNLAFCVVIMRDIFRDVSKEVEEAARIEGASLWQIFWMIAVPLSLDGLIVTAFIVFAFCWNEALFASAVTSQHAATMPAFILASRSTRGVDFNQAAVNTLVAIAPPVIMSFFVQRYLARGLSFGAVKG
ncbi:MAG: carbohydrate ABC transporter permease [Verrucomicrobia bacterium]|nr:carbohydrate ABC transporter permease [Verrucomicrobiota bacterium]